MPNFLRWAAVTAVFLSSPAVADSSSFSYELGLIVGSAQVCDYKLSADAVSAYVAANVPGDDLRFASNFSMHVSYHRSEAEKLSGLELRIHCEAALRSAEHLKLLVP
jgi:hypothetical protein